jgi:hypothetical protein
VCRLARLEQLDREIETDELLGFEAGSEPALLARLRLPWGLGPAADGTGEAVAVAASLLACGGWIALGLRA